MAKKEDQVTTVQYDINSPEWKARMAKIQSKLDKKYDGFKEKHSNVGYRVQFFNF